MVPNRHADILRLTFISCYGNLEPLAVAMSCPSPFY